MSDPASWAEAEWSHDCLSADDRPRTAIRNGWSNEQYEEAVQDSHTYDPTTGEWT